MISLRIPAAVLPLALLVACADTPAPDFGALAEPALLETASATAPPGATPGSCWGKDVTAGKIETVQQPVLMQPAQVLVDGTMISPPVYKTETLERIIEPQRETWFEVPCADAVTEDFVASVQRALAARGLFYGSINGEMDAQTRAAVRRFQKPQGLDSGILSLAAARKLGLAVETAQAPPGAAKG